MEESQVSFGHVRPGEQYSMHVEVKSEGMP